MEQLTKTIAEVKTALDQATQVLEENQTLREEIKSLKESQTGTASIEDLKVLKMAYQAGRDAVIGQLRFESYETTHEVEESTYSDGFEVQFSKEVEIEISVDAIIDECYEEEEMDSDDFKKLQEDIQFTLKAQLETDVLNLEQITTNKIEA